MKLVIVESPAKAKTIGRFLGKEYKVAASYGHVRDLPSSAEEIPAKYKGEKWARMAVDTEHGFQPIYVVPASSRKHIAELKKLVKDADEIILATDEDREGESISWHLLEVLAPKVPVKRIAFHEITHEAIDEALANPRDLNQELVRAQESRRVLDRLFGYSLSPVLWKKVRPKLSAGRVQSVAVRLIVEREEERRRFKRAKYFSIDAHLKGGEIEFDATLVEFDGKKPASGKDFDADTGKLTNEASNGAVWLDAETSSRLATELDKNLPWRVSLVEQKAAKQKPYPPFMTSTLQQAASALLGFSPRKTMQIAQKLYEGIDLGSGEREGIITYMRTDSLTLSSRALGEAGRVIEEKFGKENLCIRKYTTKSKNAQEAHEAIRPTHLSRMPDSLRSRLSDDELALYRIIWNRTIASQMAEAELLRTRVEFEAQAGGKKAVLRATGSVVVKPGYLLVADTHQQDTVLPPVSEGDVVNRVSDAPSSEIQLQKIAAEEHETTPPARYTEASLIKRLEDEGIGRPSTYAPTISTIEARGYVERRGKALVPSFLAVAVTKLLRDHFPEYVDVGFTAQMEDALDNISNGDQDSLTFLEGFYRGHGKFGHGLEPQIAVELPKIEFPAIPLGDDPKTKEPIVVRIGRNAPYLQRGEGGNGNTAPVPMDATFEELNIDHALELFEQRAKGDEPIGKHPDTGDPIYLLIGPYGPYVQLGEVTEDKKKKPKRASLPKGMKPEDVDIPTAVRLLSLPRDLGTHPESGDAIVATVGRFGPYIKCGDDTRSLRGDDDVYTVTHERALELLAQPKIGRGGKKVLATLGDDADTGTPIQVCEGKYGPYITNGEKNAKIPSGVEPGAVTLEQAKEALAAAPARKSKGRRKSPAKSPAKKKSSTKKKSAAKSKAKSKAGASTPPESTPRPSTRPPVS